MTGGAGYRKGTDCNRGTGFRWGAGYYEDAGSNEELVITGCTVYFSFVRL